MKTLIFVGMTLGSIIGGYLPVLIGVDPFSLTSLLTSGVGSIIGVFAGYKLGQMFLS